MTSRTGKSSSASVRLWEVGVLYRTVLLASAMLVASPAHAAPQRCGGTLSNLYIDDAGTVLAPVSWRGDYVSFCNVNQSVGTVPQTTCMAWLWLMRSAVPGNYDLRGLLAN